MAPDAGRLVITGLGVVSPIGTGKDAFWDALEAGRSGIRPVTLFDTAGTQARLAGEITDFDPAAILGQAGLRLLDRTTRLALCASKLALADAGLESSPPAPEDLGVSLGTTLGSMTSRADFCEQVLREGFRAVNPALFPNTVISSPSSQVAIRFAIRGFAASISTGFTSSLVAIEYAAKMLRDRRARFALAGGVEELSARTFTAFDALGLLSNTAHGAAEQAAPGDRRRNGMVMGEGAVMFVLEPLASARARGAVCLAEYLGGAGTSDRRAYQRYPEAEARAAGVVSDALGRAGVAAADIQCIAAGANGSPDGDRLEGAVFAAAFAGARRPHVFAVKSTLGESFSASGALQMAGALGALAGKGIPPTPTCTDPDPQCGVGCEARHRPASVERALVTAVSPLGHTAALVVGRM